MLATIRNVGEQIVGDAVFKVGVSQCQILVLILLEIPHANDFFRGGGG